MSAHRVVQRAAVPGTARVCFYHIYKRIKIIPFSHIFQLSRQIHIQKQAQIPISITNFQIKRTRGYSTKPSMDLSGVFPPIPTPFENGPEENISWEKLKFNMDKWNATPIKGYLVQGSNGEYCYLTMEERVEMVKKVC